MVRLRLARELQVHNVKIFQRLAAGSESDK